VIGELTTSMQHDRTPKGLDDMIFEVERDEVFCE